MTNRTMPILINDDPPVQSARYPPAVRIDLALTEQYRSLNLYLFHAAESSDDALFVHNGVCVAYPSAKV